MEKSDGKIDLAWAAAHGDVEAARAALSAMGPSKRRSDMGRLAKAWNWVSGRSWSLDEAVWAAMKSGEPRSCDCIALLVEAGADPDQGGPGGWEGAPIMLVAMRLGRHEAAATLARMGARLEANKSESRDALMEAAARGETAGVEAFLRLGPAWDLSAGDCRGRTALMLAAALGSPESVRALAKAGAPLEAVDREGATALALAAMLGRAESAVALLSAGADPDRRTPQGMDPLMLAAMHGRVETVEALLGVCDPRAADASGWSALMWACHTDRPACARVLMDRSDPFQKNAEGDDAASLARGGCVEVARRWLDVASERAELEAATLAAGSGGRSKGRL